MSMMPGPLTGGWKDAWPLAPALPRKVWIKQPRPTIQTQETTQIIQVA